MWYVGFFLGGLLALVGAVKVGLSWGELQFRPPEPRFMHSGLEDVRQALRLAGVQEGELVADLGCGDGRAVVIAAREFGARGVCVEKDASILMDARANARIAGVERSIEFIHGDIRDFDVSGINVVFLYLSENLNAELEPKLRRFLGPGSRVVSVTHSMPSWSVSDERRWVDEAGRYRVVRLYRQAVPVGGV